MMEKMQPLNLVFCIDDKFAVHLAALMRSILSNTDSQISWHIFYAALSSANQMKLTQTSGNGNHIKFYQIEGETFSSAQISKDFSDRLSVVTYFRLLIPQILASINTKVLFLDADMIVNADVSDLFAIDLQDKAAGVVVDSLVAKGSHSQTLGLKSHSYFNAGMLLIDLPMWRSKQITETAMRMVDNGTDYKFNDQDILNLTLDSDVMVLDGAWNIQQSCLEALSKESEVKIVHFNGAEKPWQHSSIHPFTHLYRKYKSETVFADVELEHYLDEHDHALIKKVQDKNIRHLYIYGAGQKGRRVARYLQHFFSDIHIEGMLDKSPKIDTFFKIPVLASDISLKNIPVIVASAAFEKEIVALLGQKKVPESNIITITDQ